MPGPWAGIMGSPAGGGAVVKSDSKSSAFLDDAPGPARRQADREVFMPGVTFCPQCRKRLPAAARFCRRCGAALAEVQSPAGRPRPRGRARADRTSTAFVRSIHLPVEVAADSPVGPADASAGRSAAPWAQVVVAVVILIVAGKVF